MLIFYIRNIQSLTRKRYMSIRRLFLHSWAISASMMLVMWVIFLVTQNAAVVDLGWALSIIVIGIYTFMQMERGNWVHSIFLELLLIWAIRLGGFLFYTRLLPGHIDGRYAAISQSFSSYEALNFLVNYQVQALLASLFVFALHAAFSGKRYPTPLVIVAATCCLAGLVGEAMADYQLFSFKDSGASGICDVGLWHYSRHPNYFFELLFWVGFAMTGLRSYKLLYGFITPLSLWVIMTYITIPLTERVSLAKRPSYKAYMEKTNKLLPIKRK